MATGRLAVLLYGKHIADLDQTAGGQHQISFLEDSGPNRLSLSMPSGRRVYKHRITEPFINGLLPDNPSTREAIGRQFGVSGRNPFAMLSHIGLDCAGAVQFCDPDRVDEVLGRGARLVKLSEDDIAVRLAELSADGTRSWLAPDERWSLGGAQSKFTLRREGNDWFEATGAAPTTHIVKPGAGSLRDQAMNEHVCMASAGRLGLDVARTSFTLFGGQPAILVERYDRRRSAAGELVRIHQEDMCQALSVDPSMKYETDGGPGVDRIVQLLRQHAPARDRETFAQYLVFNYLIGGSDAHAKNFSVLLVGQQVRLAPLYDVASAFPYDPPASDPFRLIRIPMKVNGENQVGRLTRSHWAAFARKSGLDPDWMQEQVSDQAQRLPDAVSESFNDLQETGAEVTALSQRLLPKLAEVCAGARH